MEGGSWTSDRSWVSGYETILDPMNRLSGAVSPGSRAAARSRRAALSERPLICWSQTSCYRYWGSGRWTDMAQELCRRASEILARLRASLSADEVKIEA
jgi:hypothetical protein